MRVFEEIVHSTDLKIYQMHKESENLINIKDTLLPKLMSDEIDIGELRNEEAVIKK